MSDSTAIKPITSATNLLRRVRNDGYDKIIVALSGGKDSITTLDLCAQVFGENNIYPFYLYWFKLDCEMDILSKIARHYSDMPKVTLIPHYALADVLRSCSGRTLTPSIADRFQKKSMYTNKHCEQIARGRVGKGNLWIAGGHRMSDGLHRRGMLHKCGGFWKTATATGKAIHRVYPIYEWSTQDVFTYLKIRKLPIPDMFGNNYNQASGVEITNPVFMQHLKKHYPKDYIKVKKMFPFIEDSLHRDEIRAKYAIANQSNIETDFGR